MKRISLLPVLLLELAVLVGVVRGYLLFMLEGAHEHVRTSTLLLAVGIAAAVYLPIGLAAMSVGRKRGGWPLGLRLAVVLGPALVGSLVLPGRLTWQLRADDGKTLAAEARMQGVKPEAMEQWLGDQRRRMRSERLLYGGLAIVLAIWFVKVASGGQRGLRPAGKVAEAVDDGEYR